MKKDIELSNELEIIYYLLGIISSGCFGVQYLPQMMLNYRRKSCQGFSSSGIIIKLIGASFLFINAWLTGETLPIVFYGLINVLQHTIFLFQFSIYDSLASRKYLPWIGFPIIPFLIGIQFPYTMFITNSFKPITQVLSHLPQVALCYQSKTTNGVSLPSQYLNFIGGIAGVISKYYPIIYFFVITNILIFL
ncbi:hypothetical protein DICPUDRAFT_42859 [Dictyostelium purpureum]|uniref:Uncharacterized protein n=1 Tax=Dictyostelium purpureum TaxID=5786 RepID=F1A2W9_DICPU|nr:uncharacterized protein DICPUDRAFT_42859 [Dictyostelium purpureum]EGC29459.1 hypothetical protein DICPUDRAFT_42859 [Dictyostelium purpureum]|eukprot:XP_003294013.1 hypothetical protein DICPUDRAFT_42859 [Dictyostelium purpureum]